MRHRKVEAQAASGRTPGHATAVRFAQARLMPSMSGRCSGSGWNTSASTHTLTLVAAHAVDQSRFVLWYYVTSMLELIVRGRENVSSMLHGRENSTAACQTQKYT